MKIIVVGTGYVGLVTGTCFAETGISVTCVDIDETKIGNLKKGIIPIYEPGLEALIQRNVEKQRLFFSTRLKECLENTDVVFIAVGTPPGEDGSADLSHVTSVAREIGRLMNHYLLVVTKSTVPIGTSIKVKAAVSEELAKRNKVIDFDIASNPEFLKEGNAIDDFLKPDRIVIGIETERAEKVMQRLYKPFVLNGHPILSMDIPSAEMTKYTANAMLATKISFMNDIANLCDIVGADVNMVRKGIGSDSRIGPKFIYAGVGYGGSCFPKDVKALIKTASDHNYSLKILKMVEEVNDFQKTVLMDKILAHFVEGIKGKSFAIWGLSFKPHTDDMREAPSLRIIEKLLEHGARVKAYDPASMNECKKIIGNSIVYCKDPYDALVNADALILLTEWPEFRVLNFPEAEKLMHEKVIFDGRNIYEPADMTEFGFTYYSIGRKTIRTNA
jgi:UDPglucose 6-dehydrogenase